MAHTSRSHLTGVLTGQMMEGGTPGMASTDSDEDAGEQQVQLRRDLLLGHLILQSLQPSSPGSSTGPVAEVAADLEQQGLLPRWDSEPAARLG